MAAILWLVVLLAAAILWLGPPQSIFGHCGCEREFKGSLNDLRFLSKNLEGGTESLPPPSGPPYWSQAKITLALCEVGGRYNLELLGSLFSLARALGGIPGGEGMSLTYDVTV